MGLIEIGMTIAAWKKGWGPRALLPLLGVLAYGFMLGAVLGASGAKPADMMPVAFLGDIAAIVILGRMIARPPVPISVIPAPQESVRSEVLTGGAEPN